MRTHITLTLRNLIMNDMHPDKHQMSQQDISIWIETLPLIKDDMFRTMNTLTSIIFEKRLIRRQISQIQLECVLLLDGIDKLPELTKEMQRLQKSLISCISEILEQIERVYPNYMDEDIRMPQMQVITEAAHVQASIEMLAELFLTREVDPQLQKAVLHCMKDAARLKRITYGRMRYVQRLQTLLIELLSNSHPICDESICRLLNEENYNFIGFMDYYKQRIRNEEEARGERGYLANLEQYKHHFSKNPYKKKAVHYDKNARRCHQVMHDFVLAEIAARKPKVPRVFYMPPESTSSKQHKTEKPYKVKTVLSVESLAYMVKLMLEAKVIEAGVKTELFDFIARNFETPGTAENGMSAGSFSTKFKNVVQATAATVRAKLARMMLIIDEEFI